MNAGLIGSDALKSGNQLPCAIPNYDLLSPIDEGGFGTVWLATERMTGVRRAVKVLRKRNLSRAERDLQGVRRYQTCSHNHPHLMQILTVGETDDCFFYVMEAADNANQHENGPYQALTLRGAMERSGRMTGRAALDWMAKLVSAISRLHAQGLAHHDLKPENILIVEGQPKIADVGLVGTLGAGVSCAGTPAYMTPDGRADDLYAIGLILYEMITGWRASQFPRLPAQLLAEQSGEIPAAVQIVNRLCHRDPAKRYESLHALERALEGALASRKGLRAGWRRLPRQRKRLVGVLAGMGIALTTVLGTYVYLMLVPVRLQTFTARLDPLDWAPANKRQLGEPEEFPLHPPAILFNNTPLMGKSSPIVQRLHPQVEHFVLEARFQALRSWGELSIGLSSSAEACDGARCTFIGQPDGEGLYSAAQIPGCRIEQNQKIEGHPQPGIEYVARLSDCGDKLRFELWPLSRGSSIPIVRELPWRPDGFIARYFVVEHRSDHFPHHVNLLALSVHEMSTCLGNEMLPAPAEVLTVPRAVRVVPRPIQASQAQEVDILAGAFHPYRSSRTKDVFWSPIGNWSWWCQQYHEDEWTLVRAVPFSTENRNSARLPNANGDVVSALEGMQFLRFDGAAFGDFRARARIKLRFPDGRAWTEPDVFSSSSHEGMVGIAFRLQDQPIAPCAWGGGYIAAVAIHPTNGTPKCIIQRFDGLILSTESEFAIQPSGSVVLKSIKTEGIARERFFREVGFDLILEARGPRFTMKINDAPALETDNGAFQEGCIGLYVSRMMATFESFHVQALGNTSKPP